MSALTVTNHEAFAQQYCLHGSSAKAAIAIGFPPTRGYQLIRRAEITARIQELNAEQFAHVGVTAETVKAELSRVAFASGRDLFDANNNLIPIADLSDDVAATITGIDVERRKGEAGEASFEVLKIRRADKMAALALLARHFKVVGGEDDGVNALANVLADKLNEAKARRLAGQDTEDARIIGPRLVTDSSPEIIEQLFEHPQADPKPVEQRVEAFPLGTTESSDEEELW
jgi:hypothetical protein